MKSQVFRCFVCKRPGFDVEAQGLCRDLREQLGIEDLNGLTIFHRYDVEGVDAGVYERAKGTVFSEPQVDAVYDGDFPRPEAPHALLAVEALPGQFDQRADSCAQCIQLMAGVERRQGIRAGGGPVPGGPGQNQGLSHQPGGKPGGVHGQAGHPCPRL